MEKYPEIREITEQLASVLSTDVMAGLNYLVDEEGQKPQDVAHEFLQEDLPELTGPVCCGDRLLLLGPHDPYLDTRDRNSILSDPALQKLVWRTVGNPGVLLRGGAAVGCWRVKTVREQLDFTLTPFRPLTPEEERGLTHLAEEYAAFRCAGVKKLSIASL